LWKVKKLIPSGSAMLGTAQAGEAERHQSPRPEAGVLEPSEKHQIDGQPQE
jgi:hypothetical protein